jgi:biopolymer transport protein ExbD
MARYQKKKREEGFIITSLVDFFTVLVIFLIMNFASEGNILTGAENLVLPYSTSRISPKEVTVSMNCSYDWVVVDNIPVIRTPEVGRQQGKMVIDRVKSVLERCMRQEEAMVRIGALTRIKGEIIVQVDKNIDFDIIYKLMATCGEAGYTNIRLAVLASE